MQIGDVYKAIPDQMGYVHNTIVIIGVREDEFDDLFIVLVDDYNYRNWMYSDESFILKHYQKLNI